jgi:G3E family GTPase
VIPLTVIAGYLGAGKTHLINRMLHTSSEPIGICVNDFGELNIDAALIQNRSGTTLELTNGCVCCQLTDDLGVALESMRNSHISRVIIEASGVALPNKIAAYGRNWPGYQLHKTYTLVDASNIHRWLDDKYVGALAASQIQQADELLITKLDLVDPTDNRGWAWMRGAQADWQVLSKDALTQTQVAALLAPHQGHVRADTCTPTSPPHTPNLVASCHAASEPISEPALREFLRTSPQVVRAKGWFTNAQQQQYLLQHVGEQTNIELQLDGATDAKANGLVFLHHQSKTIDLATLTEITA